jgi:glycosyltransferase involved in cell wall biosynthesis
MFLVMPSICYETFGRTIIEAYAKGTPAVASRLGAMAELIDEGRTGTLFEAGNAVDLADRVTQLLDNPSQLAEMRVAARRRFAERYTAEANYRAIMEVYRDAMKYGAQKPVA